MGTEVGDQQNDVEGSYTSACVTRCCQLRSSHAWLERGVWVTPPKDLRLSDDWLWYVVRALYGMQESSKAFQKVVREMYTTYEWTLLQTVPCLAYCGRLCQDGTATTSTQKVSPADWMRSTRRCSHVWVRERAQRAPT